MLKKNWVFFFIVSGVLLVVFLYRNSLPNGSKGKSDITPTIAASGQQPVIKKITQPATPPFAVLTSALARIKIVNIKNQSFDKDFLSLRVGERLQFSNNSSKLETISIGSAGPFAISAGQTFIYSFSRPGEYNIGLNGGKSILRIVVE